MPIELGGITLTKIHKINTFEQADFVRHRIPGLDGDITQDMGRRSVRLQIQGIYYGDSANTDLEELREAYRERSPLDFLADITGGTYFSQVIIERLEVFQQAKDPNQFSYDLTVSEYVEPPAPLTSTLALVDASILEDLQSFTDAVDLAGLLSLPEFSNPLSSLDGLVDGADASMNPIRDNQATFEEPNIFNQLDQDLADGALDQQLEEQSGAFGSISSAASDLSGSQPPEISALSEQLSAQAIPEPQLSTNYTDTLTQLEALTPENQGAITQPLNDGINQLGNQMRTDIAGAIEPVKTAYESVGALLSLAGSTESASAISPRSLQRLSPRDLSGGSIGEAIQAINGVMDAFPDPLTVESFLRALLDLLKQTPRDLVALQKVPYIDEITQVLETVFEWLSIDGNQIADQIGQTLEQSAGFIQQRIESVTQPVSEAVAGFSDSVDLPQLKNLLESFRQGMEALRAAIRDNQTDQVQALLSQLNNLQNELSSALQNVEDSFKLQPIRDLGRRLNALPEQLEDQMHLIANTLNPSSELESLGQKLQGYLERVETEGFLTELAEPLTSVARDLTNQLDRLNLSAIQEPIATAAEAARGIVDTMESSLAQVAGQVKNLFDEFESLLDQIDTQAIAEQILLSIQQFQEQIQQFIQDAFGTIKDAVASAINAFQEAIDSFQPDEIIETLRSAMQNVTSVLTNDDVIGGLNQIKAVLEEVENALESVSFRTVNDLVIEQIDEAKTKLQNIDTSQLNDILKEGLKKALELLPAEAAFDELRGKLVEKMQQLADDGPIQLIEAIKEQPQKLIDAIEKFSPENLIGDALSKPFLALLDELDNFSPLDLLHPVEDALSRLREQIRRNANPARLIEPLEQPFQSMLTKVDQFNPVVIVAPLQLAVDSAIDTAVSVIPAEEFFNLIDKVLGSIQSVIDGLDGMKNVFDRLNNFLNGLEDSSGQVDAWIDKILTQLDNIGNNVSLDDAVQSLRDAIGTTLAEPLKQAIVPRLESFVAVLNDLQPQEQLNQIIIQRNRLSGESLESLPAPLKEEAAAFINGFNPLAGAINGPINLLKELLDNIATQPQHIIDKMERWDQQFHSPDAPFSSLLPENMGIDAVKNLLRDTITQLVKTPIDQIFGLFPQIRTLINSLLNPVNVLLESLQSQIGALLTGPDSLTTIRDQLEELINVIRGFNLDFLTDELEDVFNQLKGKLEAFSPTALKEQISLSFNELVDTFQLASLLPQEELNGLNQAYAEAINKLRELNPERIVIEVLQPEFEAAITPFLETFDLTEIFEALLGLLEKLKTELDDELKRTQQSFLAMLRAVPL